MEKHLTDALRAQAAEVGVALDQGQLEKLGRFLDLLLAWNRKVNLTAIADPLQAVEVHLVDSLAAAPEVRAIGLPRPPPLAEGAGGGARRVLDLGAGGGFPSLPLAVLLPEVEFVLVDAVGKKVGFLKAAIAALGLANARALHARAEGRPEREKIPVCPSAICRAFLPLPQWLALAPAYVAPGGRVIAMLGPEAAIPAPLPAGLDLASERAYRLPRSGAERRVAVFTRG